MGAWTTDTQALMKAIAIVTLSQLALLTILTEATAPKPCDAPTAPALDHAIIAVADLDRATDAFRRAGFRIKPGRLHANGLLNNHVKFPDGTEIELMTVRASAGDDMARRYAELIAAGDAGVYVALAAPDLSQVERHSTELGLASYRSASGPWQFLSFAAPSPAEAVFFTAGAAPIADADSVLQHEPRVTTLAEVWLEGGRELGELVRRLGATRCGEVTGLDGRSGQRWALRRGSVVIVPPKSAGRARVLGAVLETHGAQARTVRPLPEFWIQYR